MLQMMMMWRRLMNLLTSKNLFIDDYLSIMMMMTFSMTMMVMMTITIMIVIDDNYFYEAIIDTNADE